MQSPLTIWRECFLCYLGSTEISSVNLLLELFPIADCSPSVLGFKLVYDYI